MYRVNTNTASSPSIRQMFSYTGGAVRQNRISMWISCNRLDFRRQWEYGERMWQRLLKATIVTTLSLLLKRVFIRSKSALPYRHPLSRWPGRSYRKP